MELLMLNPDIESLLFLRSKNLGLKRCRNLLFDMNIFGNDTLNNFRNHIPLGEIQRAFLKLLIRFSFSDVDMTKRSFDCNRMKIPNDEEKSFLTISRGKTNVNCLSGIDNFLADGQILNILEDSNEDTRYDLVITDDITKNFNSDNVILITTDFNLWYNADKEQLILTPESNVLPVKLPSYIKSFIAVLFSIYMYQKKDLLTEKSYYLQVQELFSYLLFKTSHPNLEQNLIKLLYRDDDDVTGDIYTEIKYITQVVLGFGGIGSNYFNIFQIFSTPFLFDRNLNYYNHNKKIDSNFDLKAKFTIIDDDKISLHNLNRCIFFRFRNSLGVYKISSFSSDDVNLVYRQVDNLLEFEPKRLAKKYPVSLIDCRDVLNQVSEKILFKMSYNGSDNIAITYNPYKQCDMILNLGNNPYEVHPSSTVPPILVSLLGMFHSIAGSFTHANKLPPQDITLDIFEEMNSFLFYG
jgi:hypothetical protein